MRKTLLVLIIFSAFATVTYGQHQVTGVVSDEAGPLPGANVVIQGTTTGTVTDLDGKYSIMAHSKDTLVFSYMGYEDQKFKVGNKAIINVTLSTAKELLDEVVVVGYGTMRKSDLTGATQTVKVNDNVAREYNNVDEMLQGRASGVQVVSSNGNPGEAASVRIRGTTSLMGSNEPLYVVDGVVVTTAGSDTQNATSDGNSIQQNQNGLAGINPADIASIEILKDASATAIYGSRGSNGVVLITTKSGSKGKIKLDIYGTVGASIVAKTLPVLNGVDYAQYRNESDLLKGNAPSFYIDNGEVYSLDYNGGTPIIGDKMVQVNWQDYILQPGINYSFGGNASGGGKKGVYYVSATYNDINGVVENSRLQNGNFRINTTQHITKNFDVDARVSTYVGKNNFAQGGSKAGSSRSFIRSIVTFSPLYGEDVTDIQNDLGLSNPMSWINDFEDVSNELRIQTSLKLTYSLPVEGLKLQVRGGLDMWNKERRKWYGTTTQKGMKANGDLQISSLQKYGYVIDNLILYNRTFHKKHSINATAGYVYDAGRRKDNTTEIINFTTYEFTIDGPQYGKIPVIPYTTYINEETMNSFLARINYAFSSKYSITATFRADGSSKFRKGNRYGYFPSFAFAWRLTEENFMQNARKISTLKLRVGWGMTGNQAIKPYQTYSNYVVEYYAEPDNSTGLVFAPDNIANPNLKWETTSQINAGFDYGFWNDRLSGSIDYYYKYTYDLLQLVDIPNSTGYQSLLANRGTISNQGVDITLQGVAVSTKNTFLSIGGVFSLNRTKILDLGIPESPVYYDGEEHMESYYLGDNISTGQYFKCPGNIFMVGQPIAMFWGWKTDGIIQEGDTDIPAGFKPGDEKIVDLNGDGKIDLNDRTFIGDPNPDFSYGINLSFTYKGLSVTVLGNGVYGNDIANGMGLEYYYAVGQQQNIFPEAYHDAWRPDIPSEKYTRILYSNEKFPAITDRIIEKGSYFRLNNVNIGYDIPVKAISKLHIYVSLSNLFTITNYTGFDPNVTSFMSNGNIQGVDWNPFPYTRSFLLGLNVNF